jgi:hypothetical protein
MTMNGLRTLLTGRGLVESPRWHSGRLYFSDWSAGEVLAVDLDGRSEVAARVKSLPLCTSWLPGGTLVIRHRRRRPRRGLALTIALVADEHTIGQRLAGRPDAFGKTAEEIADVPLPTMNTMAKTWMTFARA